MCGVLGLIGAEDASQRVLMGLHLLQHRGQDAAGILSHDAAGFHYVRNLGLVESVFTEENVPALKGPMSLGHVRYSTAGKSELSNVQPFLLNYPYGIGLVHNGNLVNHRQLKEDLKNEYQRHPLTQSDSESILNLFAEGLLSQQEQKKIPTFADITKAVSFVFEKSVGSYSIITMIAGFGLVAFRDPQGIRPLVLGRKKEPDSSYSYILSSESTVLSFLDYEVLEDLPAGEVIAIDLNGHIQRKKIIEKSPKPCMFEWVYFASPQSDIEGRPVYDTRIALGKNMAQAILQRMKESGIQPDVVVPVPDTARTAAIAMAEELKIPYRELLIKNRYVSRTFILDTQDKREKAVRFKLAPVVSEIKGKNILLVDDSIVRGTTSRKLIELVRSSGANKVYLASTCPPINHPCFYGIDFPMQKELLAYQKSLQQIESELGADAVIYQDIESLKASIFPQGSIRPCMACVDGHYPTSIEGSERLIASRHEDRHVPH